MRPFYDIYFDYVGDTEAPRLFHRWCALGGLSALLGRQCWLPFGHWVFYPNLYILLMGTPGSRKSTAIKVAKSMCEAQGYSSFAANKTSKERFLMDMMPPRPDPYDLEALEELTLDEPSPCFVVADELTVFTGTQNMEFLSMLGDLWDCPPEYRQPKIHGKSVCVTKPTVSILSASQPEMISQAFPPEAIGQGFMSRLLMVHGDPTGHKITFPEIPNDTVTEALTDRVREIRGRVKGEIRILPHAKPLFDRLYKEFVDLEDYRFKHYSTRRFSHLLKLCLILAAARCSTTINEEDALQANTLLHYTEARMSKALGEYGKSRYSDVSNKILDVIKAAGAPVTINYIWKRINHDLDKKSILQEIVTGLQQADKLQVVKQGDKIGFTPKHSHQQTWASDLLLPDFLTAEELL